MIATRWNGNAPLPILNPRCGLKRKFADEYPERADLIFVDVRYVSGTPTFDAEGYLPHLEYTPDYALTESDRGEYTVTGNVSAAPVWRFDPAPFYADLAGSLVLTGGTGAEYDVMVAIKRFAKWRPLRHTLTIGTQRGEFARPLGCSGVWLPDSTRRADFLLGGISQRITQPNGSFVAMGPFDQIVLSPVNSVVTFEITLPC